METDIFLIAMFQIRLLTCDLLVIQDILMFDAGTSVLILALAALPENGVLVSVWEKTSQTATLHLSVCTPRSICTTAFCVFMNYF